MARAVGIDLGTTNSVIAVLEGGDPKVVSNAEGQPHHSIGGRVRQERRGTRRRSGETPGDHQPRAHHSIGQAPHGHGLVRGDRRQEVHRTRDLGAHPAEDEARRRGLPGRTRDRGGHHRSRLLRRRTAPGDQGSRPDRGSRGAADRQRADGGVACLRHGQDQRSADPGVRPRRRHVRRLGARDRRGCLRSEVDQRRHRSAATTGTSGSSTGWSRASRTTTASISPRTPWR